MKLALPYEAIFGFSGHVGLSTAGLPLDALPHIHDEKDIERVLNNSHDNDAAVSNDEVEDYLSPTANAEVAVPQSEPEEGTYNFLAHNSSFSVVTQT